MNVFKFPPKFHRVTDLYNTSYRQGVMSLNLKSVVGAGRYPARINKV